nr:tRNA lysidine(34) synthetase TilS [Marivivens donghaensis]
MEQRAGDGPFAIAVSGGGDSMALLDMAIRLAPDRVKAVTVDHGLRAEAAGEAEAVAAFCAEHGVPHTVLHWKGAAAEGNLMEAARHARYQLIADWAKGQGIDTVLLGHTKDDQSETFLMQLTRGAGVDGLSAMSDAFDVGGAKFIRPLLSVTRQELRHYLTDRNIAWADDPTNDNPKYARVRFRQAMPTLADLGLTHDALAKTVAAMQSGKDALDHYAAIEAARLVTIVDGDVVIPQHIQPAIPADIERRIWLAILMWIGGGTHTPRQSALDELAAAIADGRGHTVNGCQITIKYGAVRVTRELSAISGKRIASTETWDRRWRLNGPHEAGLEIAPLGEQGLRDCPDWRETRQPRHTLIASPAVWRQERLVSAPLAGFSNDWEAQIVTPFTVGKKVH